MVLNLCVNENMQQHLMGDVLSGMVVCGPVKGYIFPSRQRSILRVYSIICILIAVMNIYL